MCNMRGRVGDQQFAVIGQHGQGRVEHDEVEFGFRLRVLRLEGFFNDFFVLTVNASEYVEFGLFCEVRVVNSESQLIQLIPDFYQNKHSA